jgi:hypothetical protein
MSTDLAVVLVLLAAMEAWLRAFHRRLGEPRDREGDTRMPRPAALVLGLLTLAVWSLAGLTVPGSPMRTSMTYGRDRSRVGSERAS